MDNPNRIFISYHRSDTEADAGRLSDTLKEKLGNNRVFLDVSDVELGTNWERVVDHNLQNSVALLLVIGPSWSPTEPIKYEIGIALNSGIPIIPILVRKANLVNLTSNLPSELKSVEKLNAMALDHSRWNADTNRLVELLDRILADPLQSRVILTPPDRISILNSSLARKNIRSLLYHAADLAICLDDESILEAAEEGASKQLKNSNDNWMVEKEPSDLIYLLGNARYRLMIEQIGFELLNNYGAVHVAQYLMDPELEDNIREAKKKFEDEKRGWHLNRGDGPEDPKYYHDLALEASARAKDLLREQPPGLTKNSSKRDQLFKRIEKVVNDILSKEKIEDNYEYVVLKHFSAYRDMRFEISYSNNLKVKEMLGQFKKDKSI